MVRRNVWTSKKRGKHPLWSSFLRKKRKKNDMKVKTDKRKKLILKKTLSGIITVICLVVHNFGGHKRSSFFLFFVLNHLLFPRFSITFASTNGLAFLSSESKRGLLKFLCLTFLRSVSTIQEYEFRKNCSQSPTKFLWRNQLNTR